MRSWRKLCTLKNFLRIIGTALEIFNNKILGETLSLIYWSPPIAYPHRGEGGRRGEGGGRREEGGGRREEGGGRRGEGEGGGRREEGGGRREEGGGRRERDEEERREEERDEDGVHPHPPGISFMELRAKVSSIWFSSPISSHEAAKFGFITR